MKKQEYKEIDEQKYKKICSIIKSENEDWNFFDYNGSPLRKPSETAIFTSAMKRRYLKTKSRIDIPTVWVLVGFDDENKITWEQVGSTKDIINALVEIKNAIKSFYSNGKKYGVLKNENYKKLVFYEVDIDNYLRDDLEFENIYGEALKNNDLKLAYYYVRATYIEGKIGYDTSARMYNPYILDGYFYNYFKNKKS